MKQLLKAFLPIPILKVLRRSRQWWNRRRWHAILYRRMLKVYPRRIVEHHYGGTLMRVMIADPDGALWYDREHNQLPEIIRLSQSRLRPGATVFNLGAHQGVVAMLIANQVGPTGRVIAVDPQPLNVELMNTNFQLNGLTQITALQTAVGDKQGSITFGVNLNDRVDPSGKNAAGSEVPITTISQLIRDHGRPDVVFIDVEGFEGNVLDGARELFAGPPVDWFVEVHVNCGLENFGKRAEDILNYFPQSQYALLIASEKDREFLPLAEARYLLNDRFFLLALHRSPVDNGGESFGT